MTGHWLCGSGEHSKGIFKNRNAGQGTRFEKRFAFRKRSGSTIRTFCDDGKAAGDDEINKTFLTKEAPAYLVSILHTL